MTKSTKSYEIAGSTIIVDGRRLVAYGTSANRILSASERASVEEMGMWVEFCWDRFTGMFRPVIMNRRIDLGPAN